MPELHATRRDRFRELLAAAGQDAALVTRGVNVRYLSGFTGSNGALLVTSDGATLATDGRYQTQAAAQAPDVEVVIDRAVATALTALAARRRLGRLGFESHDVSVDTHGELVEAGAGLELVSMRQAVERRLRAVKG